MSKLRELLNERDGIYAEYSNKILNEISENVVPAIVELLQFNDNEITKLEWSNVQLLDGFVVLSGLIKYHEGDTISEGNNTITLDANLATMLDKLVKVAVPLELAETGSKEEIVKHLQAAQEHLRDEYEDLYGDDDLDSELDVDESMLDTTQMGMDFSADFNYNDLTEEQRKALYLTGLTATKGDKLN